MQVSTCPFHALGYAAAGQAHRILCGTTPDPLHVVVPSFDVIERVSTIPHGHSTDPIVNRALKRIAREDRSIPSVTALARYCRVRRQLLFEHFKRELRKSPEAWIKERAMQRAAQLLAETDLPMQRIAVKCGIAQRTNLSKRFKERFGMSPSSYRKQIKGGHRGSRQ